MKKDLHIEFYRNYIQNRKVNDDNFFANETIEKVQGYLYINCEDYHRFIGKEEAEVISLEAFELLLFWVQAGELEIEYFERFLSILVTFSERVVQPIDKDIAIAMIEMMKLVDFKEHVIYTTIELYLEAPDLLRYRFDAVH